MYKYTLKKKYKSRMFKWYDLGKRHLKWEEARSLAPKGSAYHDIVTYSSCLDVVYYSKTRRQTIPAANGVLVDVALYDEEKIGDTT